ncbi:hypothetical protein [Glycomyces sambucus]|uniref:hypothetical protein n=1 Tax=Glycomyces sambucus TaxID=380244 RepID=UPI00115FFCA5|nr:hypothetical protein [Glycomyces sambucus]
MKTVLLDANELACDFLCTGFLVSDLKANLASPYYLGRKSLTKIWSNGLFNVHVDFEWGGLFEVIRGSDTPDETSLVEYAVDYNVEFEAEFPESFEPDPGWTIELTKISRAVRADGSIRLIIRIAVLFGGEFGFSVEQLSWRRADGDGPGFPVYRPELDLNQLSLFAAMGLGED